MTPQNLQIQHLTRRDLSGRWRKSKETLKRWERTGKLKPLKIGRDVLYRREDIEAIEAEAEVRR